MTQEKFIEEVKERFGDGVKIESSSGCVIVHAGSDQGTLGFEYHFSANVGFIFYIYITVGDEPEEIRGEFSIDDAIRVTRTVAEKVRVETESFLSVVNAWAEKKH